MELYCEQLFKSAMDETDDLDLLYLELFSEFVQDLKKTHGKNAVKHCLAFHIASGSGLPESQTAQAFFDFSGADSILRFLENFLNKHKPEQLAQLQNKYKRSES
ncbi:hypothetical protein GF391_04180 [Candidatus Uhrbacteria bacterium]|nr:hypothetical protein [Candidatus Uhrbacteria bacterium]